MSGPGNEITALMHLLSILKMARYRNVVLVQRWDVYITRPDYPHTSMTAMT